MTHSAQVELKEVFAALRLELLFSEAAAWFGSYTSRKISPEGVGPLESLLSYRHGDLSERESAQTHISTCVCVCVQQRSASATQKLLCVGQNPPQTTGWKTNRQDSRSRGCDSQRAASASAPARWAPQKKLKAPQWRW